MTLTNDQIKQRFGEALITKAIRSATDNQIASFVESMIQDANATQKGLLGDAIRKGNPRVLGQLLMAGIRSRVRPIIESDIDTKMSDDVLTREEFSDLVE